MSNTAIYLLYGVTLIMIVAAVAFTAGQEQQQLPVPEYIEPATYDGWDVFEVSLTKHEAMMIHDVMMMSGNYLSWDVYEITSNRCEIMAERRSK